MVTRSAGQPQWENLYISHYAASLPGSNLFVYKSSASDSSGRFIGAVRYGDWTKIFFLPDGSVLQKKGGRSLRPPFFIDVVGKLLTKLSS